MTGSYADKASDTTKGEFDPLSPGALMPAESGEVVSVPDVEAPPLARGRTARGRWRCSPLFWRFPCGIKRAHRARCLRVLPTAQG